MDTKNEDSRPLRMGFAVKALGGGGELKSGDARRWQSDPHLRVSIGYLREMFAYLGTIGGDMYRMSSDIAPYVTHPDMPQFHNQIRECEAELAELGALARALDIRLSIHPSQYIVLNSPNAELVQKSIADLSASAAILDAMGCGSEAVLVIHVGGTYGDHTSGCDRWVRTWDELLPASVKRRLTLENDDIRYSAADVLDIHARTGVPLIFDIHHYLCNNPEGLELLPTVAGFLASWPDGVRPKMHYSSPNTNFREVQQRDKKTGKPKKALLAPIWTGHADFINPFEFASFARTLGSDFRFDVMLEAKAKDLALIRLKRDLRRYAPDVAAKFGLEAAPPEADDEEVLEELEDAAEGAPIAGE